MWTYIAHVLGQPKSLSVQGVNAFISYKFVELTVERVDRCIIVHQLQGTGGMDNREQLLTSNLVPLLVHLASQATRLNRQWILRDLEVRI